MALWNYRSIKKLSYNIKVCKLNLHFFSPDFVVVRTRVGGKLGRERRDMMKETDRENLDCIVIATQIILCYAHFGVMFW